MSSTTPLILHSQAMHKRLQRMATHYCDMPGMQGPPGALVAHARGRVAKPLRFDFDWLTSRSFFSDLPPIEILIGSSYKNKATRCGLVDHALDV